MRILLICDDHWHPGQVPVDGFSLLKDKGFDFDIITDANELKPDTFSNYSVIVLSKSRTLSPDDDSRWMTETLQQSFVTYVENGGGLLVTHSGLVSAENNDRLDMLIGSKFTFHPNSSSVTVQPINKHPVVDGAQMFCEFDEHYRLEMLADDIDVFMASYSAPLGDPPKIGEDPYNNTTTWLGAAGYSRIQGKGRVCALTPGHFIEIWTNPQYQRILENALNWCGSVK